MMTTSHIVYEAMSPSGKRYIGCTSRGLAKRKSEHRSNAAKFGGYKFYRAISKYGFDAFIWRVLGAFGSVEEMHAAERRFIAEFNSVLDGYNITSGGQGALGRRNTPKQNAAHAERQRARFARPDQRAMASASVSAWVNSHPIEHASNVSKRLSRLRSKEARAGAASRQLDYIANTVDFHAIHSERARKRYVERPDIAEKISSSLGGRKFEVFRDGAVVGAYSTIQGCARDLGVSAGNLHSCLRGRRSQTGGYEFRYT